MLLLLAGHRYTRVHTDLGTYCPSSVCVSCSVAVAVACHLCCRGHAYGYAAVCPVMKDTYLEGHVYMLQPATPAPEGVAALLDSFI